MIHEHASLQSPTSKWRNNILLKTCCFLFYEQGGRYFLEGSATLYMCNINIIGLYISTIVQFHRRDWNFLGAEGFCKAKKFKEILQGLLEFPERLGGGVLEKISSMGEVWILSGITQWTSTQNLVQVITNAITFLSAHN